ncbi:Histone chaperone ASF1 [Cryomyces minteri]|uniref:Histone chaperone n=1 Tax=Cryomyces minteri TaxID=331657 RepID=A0A4V5NE36_9PEZI|nr:Histone chaperone ASF1 [Cryomyces minteri]
MSVVSLLNVAVRNNPAAFDAPYEFEITFEYLEWKLTYVGSATSSEHDQELDSLLVGPIPVGVNKFIFEADPPNLSRIPTNDIIGVTVILLTCSYDSREFVRVGYYVNNEYTDEALIAEPPKVPIIEKVRRNILAEKPRVTRFGIKWDSEESAPAEFPPDQPEADALEEDGTAYGAEEEEEEEAIELTEGAKVEGDDAEMAGAEETVEPAKEEDEASDAGSEDLEAESSGSDEDDDDEEPDVEGEGEAEADEEMDTGEEATTNTNGQPAAAGPVPVQPMEPTHDVMVH